MKFLKLKSCNASSTLAAKNAKIALYFSIAGADNPQHMYEIEKLQNFIKNAVYFKKIATLNFEGYEGELLRVDILNEKNEPTAYLVSTLKIIDAQKNSVGVMEAYAPENVEIPEKDKSLGKHWIQFCPCINNNTSGKIVFPNGKNATTFVIDELMDRSKRHVLTYRIIENRADVGAVITCTSPSSKALINRSCVFNNDSFKDFDLRLRATGFKKPLIGKPAIDVLPPSRGGDYAKFYMNPYFADPVILKAYTQEILPDLQ